MSQDSPKLVVSFDEPSDRWLGISVTYDEKRFTESFSWTPNDFISELVGSLRLILSGSKEVVATASYNPGGYEFRFLADNDLTLDIQEFDRIWTNRREAGDSVFRVSLPFEQIIRPFWLAMTRLEVKFSAEEYESRMGRRFPSRKLELLGEAVRTMEHDDS